MQHAKLERLRALIASAQDARRPTSYTSHFEGAVAANTLRPEILTGYEQDLLMLDVEAWRQLKASAVKRLIHNNRRGWEPLFGILNEAKGYAYLTALGCTDIKMIPHSYECKRPDFSAALNGALVLCEVKTIHMSDDARTIRPDTSASRSKRCLSEDFLLGKLTRTLRAAKAQLDAFPSSTARKLIYVVFNPDESLHEYADDYSLQLRAFLKESSVEGVEVECSVSAIPSRTGSIVA